ncbi:bifunctional WD40-YVTN repeat-like-containing domain superfamily/WD40 repeat/WD40-repeat-containing domain superfamily/G-protein beta WD-40 repeat/WD40 repeat [Babesia duncani]|uniref:Bifunctional WD40-YVTN repeat-like-containing domain superfamily/WD40 repeat/WD40-repeat-containing domain superfamily/G-protein beta WD-40 repeat/WD40 repeat n=1 Tax=Babesia duncani TaxID=323732 RepID=A0AAD9PNT3_9APIC|nr:bifunctional WD40-YVTN repeat-like-containing domain superfamily/WD40 repeat/WD40-repeat-containing domain superfamily/G-protein beta WD-40 repeat/WD40 repeat [Babesia duncani]
MDSVNFEENSLKSPVLLLTGHEGEVYCLEFSPDGNTLATSGRDANILLFQVFGDCTNYAVFTGHKNAVLELHWGGKQGEYLYSCSADYTAALWDVEYRKRACRFAGHSGIVNSCFPARHAIGGCLVTGSDDGTVKIWDNRSKRFASSIQHDFQVLSVCTDLQGNRIYSGCLDNLIRVC